MRLRILVPLVLVMLAPLLGAEPITLLGGISGDRLFFIDSAAPSTVLDIVMVTGLAPGHQLAAIDYRPATGELYGG